MFLEFELHNKDKTKLDLGRGGMAMRRAINTSDCYEVGAGRNRTRVVNRTLTYATKLDTGLPLCRFYC